MTQTFSRWLLTAEARVRARIIPFGLREAIIWHFTGLYPGNSHTSVSIFKHVLYTYTMNTVDATQFM